MGKLKQMAKKKGMGIQNSNADGAKAKPKNRTSAHTTMDTESSGAGPVAGKTPPSPHTMQGVDQTGPPDSDGDGDYD